MDEVERHVVRFDSDPSGASVSLDGSLICNTTPCSKEIAAGGHDVEMVLARYEPATRTIDVRTKETIEIPLSPLFGWLSVETSVSGVTLVVDGEPAGESPIRRFELTPGRHMVLTDDGEFQEVGEEFTIERGREHRVELDVTRRLGGLRIRAVDENDNALSCTAYVRRHKVGETPWSGEHRVGQHDWMVACHERGSKSGRVEIPFQKVVEVVARFDSEIEDTTQVSADTCSNCRTKAAGHVDDIINMKNVGVPESIIASTIRSGDWTDGLCCSENRQKLAAAGISAEIIRLMDGK